MVQTTRVYRVVQWTTGNVGQRSVRAAVDNPNLDIVGCYAWGADKVGRDVGELVGMDPIGVVATDDIDSLLALKPDCVIYNPKWPDVDDMVRILESGTNITSTAGFITGHALGEGRQRIIDACERGSSSVFGSGTGQSARHRLRRSVRPHRFGAGARVRGLHRLRLGRHRDVGRIRTTHR
jgi:hypothetical protein